MEKNENEYTKAKQKNCQTKRLIFIALLVAAVAALKEVLFFLSHYKRLFGHLFPS